MGLGQWGAFQLVGRPGPVLKITQELGQAVLPAAGGAEMFPLSTMVWFQVRVADLSASPQLTVARRSSSSRPLPSS